MKKRHAISMHCLLGVFFSYEHDHVLYNQHNEHYKHWMVKNWPGISHKLIVVECGPFDRYFKNQISTTYIFRSSIVSIFYPDTVFKVYIHTTTYKDWPWYLSSLLCFFISLSFFVSHTFINPHFKFFYKKLYKIIHVWCLTEYWMFY